MDPSGQVPQVRGPGEPLQVVTMPGMELRLLAAGDGTEVIEQVLQPGARWALCPQDGWAALEFFQVVSGRLRWHAPGGDVILAAGTHFSACPVREEYLFRADSAVRLLYICSQPVFHQYCADLQQMMRLAAMAEGKVGHGQRHCERLTARCMSVGRQMGLTAARLLALNYGAFLHDIGLVTVPDPILTKVGPLTAAEWGVMRSHPSVGREMVERSFLREAGAIIEQHHERLDGSGYPLGLQGQDILLEAQIVGVVDSYDAMTTDRSYRRAIGHDQACKVLRQGVGKLYRVDVVESLLTVCTIPDAEHNA